MYNIEKIKKAFKDYSAPGEAGYQHFAILVPVMGGRCGGDSCPEILYEVRAERLNRQPGEVCFPGGHIEPGESPRECALRETEEEVGICRDNIEIVSRLDSIFSTGGSQIHCFLGIIDDSAAVSPDPQEVKEIFHVSIDRLAESEPEVYTSVLRQEPDPDFPYQRVTAGKPYPWRSGKAPVPVYETEDTEGNSRIIWGLTGRITKQLMEVLKCSD